MKQTTTDSHLAALERLEALAEAATPGPWVNYASTEWHPDGTQGGYDADTVHTIRSYDGAIARMITPSGNAEFIATSRTAVPALCRALRLADEALVQIAQMPTQPQDVEKRIARQARARIAAELEAERG